MTMTHRKDKKEAMKEQAKSDQCRMCGSFESEFLIKKKMGNYESTWVFCKTCKSAHIDPYPSSQQLTDYYNSGYTHMGAKDSEIESGVNHKIRFSEEYRSRVFSEYKFSMNDAGLDPSTLAQSNSNILDFGCADGVFLDFLSSVGVPKERLFGLDIGADMVAIANKKGFQCAVDVDHLKKKQFELITLWDVIEHVPQPKEVVGLVKSMLTKGGECLLQTPNFGELGMLMGETFGHYLPLEHLNLFSRQALIDLFENQGFKCLRQSSFGANALEKYVSPVHKSAYDKLAKKYDF